ncbi:hypothetical protein [Luteolibacter luteus]|uniref:Lipoprotein n=1 Tax=Luteolibacter luteus TaxID=2728835 RepID=A0A858RG17_9BACT|nr:hypothetical protein [Luteolibacter luteus]QJE95083.1 hypothetical protein HHL09_04605 [Luteolibacter luteus]
MNRLRNATMALLLTSLGFGVSSCDKAQQAVDAAREKFRGADPSAPVSPGGELDPDLASQVDSGAEGVRFRRDLPFPTDISVRVIERATYHDSRVMSTSALGNQNAPISGKFERIFSLKRGGSQLNVEIEKAGRVIEEEAAKEAAKDPAKNKVAAVVDAASEKNDEDKRLEGASIDFLYTNQGWRQPKGKGAADFSKMVWAKKLEPQLPSLMAHDGVMPRTQWFSSSRRWSGGDKFEITGEALSMLFPGKYEGKVLLTYEVSEALDGHPCGRFSVTGDISGESAGIDGVLNTQEVSIRSGKVWCSLLYPLVLREEFETVRTTVSSGDGAKTRIQGGLDMVTSRQWKQ